MVVCREGTPPSPLKRCREIKHVTSSCSPLHHIRFPSPAQDSCWMQPLAHQDSKLAPQQPSNFFAHPGQPPPSPRPRKPLPFPLFDPFANDDFQVHDPNGFFKKRRASSSAHSVATSQESDPTHSREASAGSGGRGGVGSNQPQGVARSLARMEGVEEGKAPIKVDTATHSSVAMEDIYTTSPANEVRLFFPPFLFVSYEAGAE